MSVPNPHHNQVALHISENVREENELSATSPITSNPTLYASPIVDVDLDDHRQQLSVPRPSGSGPRSRRGTVASQSSGRPEVPEILTQHLDGGTIARDFEHAIIDDNASFTDGGLTSRNTPGHGGGRRGTFRRSRRHRSHHSSRASSPSPPTSIHAFAGQRRRDRSNTVNTNDGRPHVEGGHLKAMSSAEGLPRRRLTFSDNPGATDNEDSDSTDTSAENDVCYPQEEHPEDGPEVDWEELEEFVAEAEVPVILPTPGATTPLEKPELDVPAALPSPKIKPQDDDTFDELEKIKHESNRRPSVLDVDAPRPFYTFFSTEDDDTIHSKSLGGLLSDNQDFKELFSVRGDEGCWWLDVVRPTEEEVTVLCKAFGVHPLTREDITMQESREKVELFRHYYFVAFRSFENNKQKEDEYLEPIHVYAVVFRNGLMTFSHSSNNHASNVLRRIGKLRDYMSISSDWICYAMIDDIVDGFMPAIHDVELEVDTIEDNVFTARYEDARAVLGQIGESRRKVMSLLRLLGGKSDVIKGFAKRCNEHFSVAPTGDVGLYLSDIQDHIVTMRDNLSHAEQLLSRVHTNFLAQINVDNIEGGNKTNRMLGKVTLLATVLVPMNLVTGLFGMNVPIPGKDSQGLVWFGGIIGCILTFSLICLLTFKKLRLI